VLVSGLQASVVHVGRGWGHLAVGHSEAAGIALGAEDIRYNGDTVGDALGSDDTADGAPTPKPLLTRPLS
jgi:hypothetical protein